MIKRQQTEEVLAPFKSEPHDHGHCIADALDIASALCAERDIRLTPLRRRVLELVWNRHGPVRAYDLLDQLRGERRGAAPPTVYRALDFLLENGLIHRIESLNAYIGCGRPEIPHSCQFLICRECNAVAELDDATIRRTVADRARDLGFQVQRQTVEITGLCPSCTGEEGLSGRGY